MKEVILQCEGITKQYAKTKALSQVDMQIRRGEIYGFIGENGAGKTTLLRVITGLISATDGRLSLFGKSDKQELVDARRRVGCIIEAAAFYPHLNASDNLEYYRIQRGYPNKDSVNKALQMVNLENTGKKRYQQFSLGMKQRLGVALAIMGNPDFLILDEPINGLDPSGIIEFRQMLKSLSREYGMTILISSHILSELEQIADRYGIVHQGRLVKEFTQEQLEKDTKRYLSIKVSDSDDAAQAAAILEQKLGITEYEVLPGNELKVYAYVDNSPEVTFQLASNKVKVISIQEVGNTLESYFISAIGRKDK